MDSETLNTILDLQKKVDMYERAFTDLLIALSSDKAMIVTDSGDKVVNIVFEGVFKLRTLSPTPVINLTPNAQSPQGSKKAGEEAKGKL